MAFRRQATGLATATLLGMGIIACESPRGSAPGLIEFRCAEKKFFYIDYGPDYDEKKPPKEAVFHFGDQAVRLPWAESANRQKYTDTLTTFTMSADGSALLITRNGNYQNCRAR
jgi:hypothetical protein